MKFCILSDAHFCLLIKLCFGIGVFILKLERLRRQKTPPQSVVVVKQIHNLYQPNRDNLAQCSVQLSAFPACHSVYPQSFLLACAVLVRSVQQRKIHFSLLGLKGTL